MKKMFWIDLEMSGLDEKVDHILEVAVIVTDIQLNNLDSFHRIVFQPQDVLENMNAWCKNTHKKSGLTAKIPYGIPLHQAEKELVEFSFRHFPNAGKTDRRDDLIILCGNSVGNDKRFLDHHTKDFAKMLHYRVIDVSSFKEIFRNRFGVEIKKGDKHRAVDDIEASIDELRKYLSYIHVPTQVKV